MSEETGKTSTLYVLVLYRVPQLQLAVNESKPGTGPKEEVVSADQLKELQEEIEKIASESVGSVSIVLIQPVFRQQFMDLTALHGHAAVSMEKPMSISALLNVWMANYINNKFGFKINSPSDLHIPGLFS